MIEIWQSMPIMDVYLCVPFVEMHFQLKGCEGWISLQKLSFIFHELVLFFEMSWRGQFLTVDFKSLNYNSN